MGGGPRVPGPDFRRLFEGVPGAYLVLSPKLTIVAVTDAYLAATMTQRDAILGRSIFDVFPDNPADPAATGVTTLRSSLRHVLTERAPDTMAVQKYDIRRPDTEGGGFEERHWSPINVPMLGADGEVELILHCVEDVTEFVRIQRQGNELRSQAGRMEAEILRRAQEIQETNRRLRELQVELESRVESRTAALRRANDELVRESNEHRLTEERLRKSEEQRRQMQKLEAIGRLAGGVAHDFNNLLTVILSYGEFLLDELTDRPAMRSNVEEIVRAGNRAADLTRQLLAFSRQQVLAPRVIDLNQSVHGVIRMLERLIGEHVQLKVGLEPDLGCVYADPGQVEQVIVNLAINARDAMQNGGTLALATSNVMVEPDYAKEHAEVQPGPYVMLSVSDTGHGMDKETRARIFEPFFTTKDLGKGTGLGLATVFGIVKQSGGHIWVYSEVGAGTTFKVYLPRVERSGMPAVTPRPDPASGGNETILVVEDEDSIRAIACRVLGQSGYRVLDANSPLRALELCRSNRDPIDLLMTDVILPVMNGRELAMRIEELRPGIRVLFMSGYTDDAILLHGVLDEGVHFIQKPLTPMALCTKVREVLDSRPPAAPDR
ncbi:MAG: response regulator [Planctomycetes bacterium]|nr:response regulator [Planctomycetota bacterium]